MWHVKYLSVIFVMIKLTLGKDCLPLCVHAAVVDQNIDHNFFCTLGVYFKEFELLVRFALTK